MLIITARSPTIGSASTPVSAIWREIDGPRHALGCTQRVTDRARGASDERDHVERVAPRLVRGLAELGDEFARPRHRGRLRQRLQIEPADEVEQGLVLGPDAGQLDALVAQRAKQQRPRRVEVVEAGEVERPRLSPFPMIA